MRIRNAEASLAIEAMVFQMFEVPRLFVNHFCVLTGCEFIRLELTLQLRTGQGSGMI